MFRTLDRVVVGLAVGWVAVRWLLPGWVTVSRQLNHFAMSNHQSPQPSVPSGWINPSICLSGVAHSSVSAWCDAMCQLISVAVKWVTITSYRQPFNF